MNTAALKSFAPAVRRQLMEAVARKLDVVLAAQAPDYRTTFAPQVAALRTEAAAGREALVERVAYTWFNRLAALRYLDARGWHPFRARVLTAAEPGSTQPELLRLVREGALPAELARHTDAARLDALLDGRIPSANAQGEVYRHLVLAVCRFYHALLPDLFERLDDATELLLPDDLLTGQSVAAGFRTAITDDDCADVEVLGWLYQFYISEKKDAVMARKSAVPSEDIPAVTQLFTPHWIVRYLVENSLGRLWLLNRPGSRLRERMPYYVETEPETEFLRVERPEEIRVLDPAVGSGHMLTYAFDLLQAIYEEEGYAAGEIPGLILRHNLYGIDIDPRAAQIAQMALVFKARERARRFFQPELLVQPNVIALQDVTFAPGEIEAYVRELKLGPLFDAPVRELLEQFHQATTLGSLIQPALGTRDLSDLRRAIAAADVGGQLLLAATHDKVLRVLKQAEHLTASYHTVVANPPYMGKNQMNGAVKQYAARYLVAAKADTYAMFIVRCRHLAAPEGYVGMVTMQGWMFLASFEALRQELASSSTIVTMAHLGARAFDSISGEVVQTTAFTLRASPGGRSRSVFLRLLDARGEAEKERLLIEALNGRRADALYVCAPQEFVRIPGQPIAYWLREEVIDRFASLPAIGESADARAGMATGDNERFLRLWHEVPWSSVGLGLLDATNAKESRKKWIPYNKGGGFRKWYGNNEYVVLWENDGELIKRTKKENLAAGRITANNSKCWNQDRYFQRCITWSAIGTGSISLRWCDEGFIFDTKGQCLFAGSQERLQFFLALLNSSSAKLFLSVLSPTLDFNSGSVVKMPDCSSLLNDVSAVARVSSEAVSVARVDWDAHEYSWDFQRHPLVNRDSGSALLSATWDAHNQYCQTLISRMRELERRNNESFIAAFRLNGIVTADVADDELGLATAVRSVDATSLVSYVVGCMMGRYSLEKPSLILADAGDTVDNYLAKVGKPAESLTFAPDADGIIPVLDGEWFADDVVARTREFLRAAFGDATLAENVRWLEESLGKDLRKYFLTDFYKDHLQTYRKRPIYWLVQSPKRGFACLVYLHRYTPDTLNVVLNRYLVEYEGKLRARLGQLARDLAADAFASARERTAARKEQDRLAKVLHECEEWGRNVLRPLAQQRVALDLDDGVKVNYLKLADVLAPIPGLAAKDEE